MLFSYCPITPLLIIYIYSITVLQCVGSTCEIFHSKYLDVKILSPDDVPVLLVPAEHGITGSVGCQNLAGSR